MDPSRPKLHHLRDRDGRHEVDMVADLGARGMVGNRNQGAQRAQTSRCPAPGVASRRTRRPLQGWRAAAYRPSPLPPRRPHRGNPHLHALELARVNHAATPRTHRDDEAVMDVRLSDPGQSCGERVLVVLALLKRTLSA